MKRLINYILVLIFAGAFFTACEEDPADVNYEKLNYGDAPAFSDAIQTSNVGDSSFTLTFTPSTEGYIYYAVQDTAQDDLSRDAVIAYGESNGTKIEVDNPDKDFTAVPKELAPTHVYEVFAVHTNEMGVGTLHDKVTVKTTDTYDPVVMEFTPTPTLDGAAIIGGDPYAYGYPASEPLQITFNEPVYYNSNHSVHITAPFAGYSYTVPPDSIEADGSSTVTIGHETLPYNGALIFVNVDSAAFNDGKGNDYDGFDTYIDSEGYVHNFFFATAPNPDNVLANIFGNFSGEFVSKSYSSADSSTLYHQDTVGLTTSTEDGYTVTINNFNGLEGATATLQFKEDGPYKYITCERQSINDTLYIEPMENTYNDHGQWNPGDYSFDLGVEVRHKGDASLMESVYQQYMPTGQTKKKGSQEVEGAQPYDFLYR